MATDKDILKEILSRSLLLRLGQHSIDIIQKRVMDGVFGSGSTEPGTYSTKPFAMPAGAIQKKSVLLDILKGKHPGDAQLFKSKNSGKLWVVIKHGYQWLRQESGKQSAKVDFRWTGTLMRSLNEVKVDTVNATVTIGHSGDRNKKLADYWNRSGAGKQKKLRKWLYLTDEELKKMTETL